jgi:hypothetical protein
MLLSSINVRLYNLAAAASFFEERELTSEGAGGKG